MDVEHEARQLIQVIYVSTANRPFVSFELQALLEKARATNTGLGITGMLLHQEGSFLQLLEGDERAVDGLIARIAGDRRHGQVLTLLRGPISQPCFPDWSMGFTDVRGSAEKLIGFRRIGDLAGLVGDAPAITRVMRLFLDGRWQRAA